MFRNSGNSKMNKDFIGVGTLYEFGKDKYLIIEIAKNKVALLDLQTFKIVSERTVEDIHYLSEPEARALTPGNYTFSDFTINTKGMKP